MGHIGNNPIQLVEEKKSNCFQSLHNIKLKMLHLPFTIEESFLFKIINFLFNLITLYLRILKKKVWHKLG